MDIRQKKRCLAPGELKMLSDWDSNYVQIDGKWYEKESFFETKVVTKLTKESEKYPLLSRQAEQKYISDYQEARDKLYEMAQKAYGTVKYPKPGSWNSPQERAVIKAVITPGSPYYCPKAREAREKMVLHNLRLIKRFAKSTKTGDLGPYDRNCYGILGLQHALDKFDRNKDNGNGEPNKFSTYAVSWVRQFLQRGIVDTGRTIRIPIHIHDQINKLGKIYAQLASEYFDSPSPTAEQLAKASGIPAEQVKLLGMYRADFSITSLDKENFAGDEDDSGTLLDSCAAKEELEPEEVVEKELNRQSLNALIDKALAPDDAKFCKLFYGLVDGSPRTVREMASVMSVPRKEIQEKVDRIMLALKQSAQRDQFSLED